VQDHFQNLSTNGSASLLNTSVALTLSNGGFQDSFPAYSMTVLDLAPALTVTSIIPTPTGFTAQFNKPINPSTLALYFGSADVSLVGPTPGSPPVRGSLVVDATNSSMTFVKSGTGNQGLLSAGSYTLTLKGVSITDTGGGLLFGNGTQPGSNYVASFSVSAPSGPVLSIPDFARGPDSADNINVPARSNTGIPITLTAAVGVTDVTFNLNYNPALLNVTGTTNGPSGTFTLRSAVGGVASFVFQSSSPLSGNLTLGQIVAQVPNSAASVYKVKELLHLANIVVNGGSISALGNDGVHVTAYLGDTSGDGDLSGLDASLISRVGIALDTGFAAYPLLDPAIIGDLSANGLVDGSDVTLLSRVLVGLPQPQVPLVPPGLSMTPTGPDPLLSVPVLPVPEPGTTVEVPVDIDTAHPSGSTGLVQAILALTYDPTKFTVSAADFHLGTLPSSAGGWQLQAVVNPGAGEIGIDIFGMAAIQSIGGGSLVTVSMHPIAPLPNGAAWLTLVPAANPTGDRVYKTTLADANGALIVHGADGSGQYAASNGQLAATSVTGGAIEGTPGQAAVAGRGDLGIFAAGVFSGLLPGSNDEVQPDLPAITPVAPMVSTARDVAFNLVVDLDHEDWRKLLTTEATTDPGSGQDGDGLFF
jgi:hypothetical protein